MLFKLNGGSTTIDVGVRADVSRSLMTKAWPPIPLAEPGSTSPDVTPPEIASGRRRHVYSGRRCCATLAALFP